MQARIRAKVLDTYSLCKSGETALRVKSQHLRYKLQLRLLDRATKTAIVTVL
jgi:hypothetical protein